MNDQQDQETNVKIPIDGLFAQFRDHLSSKNNGRVFFSGKFGIGKTYFLNEFFKNNLEKYEVFHLFPINYQINNNEDVIELLKYDILIELLKKDSAIFQGKGINGAKDWLTVLYSFCKERCSIKSFLKRILSYGESALELTGDPAMSLISKLGRPLSDLLKFDEEFQNFQKEYKGRERMIVEEYMKKIGEWNVSETDYLSALLNKKIKEQKRGKESILVLDDLDRIDPEHIFRILNIFSVHFNLGNEELPNKFGFDKIILVGDQNNIENVFYHKYGNYTDFDGYFDKFFSIEVFNFNSDKVIDDVVDSIVGTIKSGDKNLSGALEPSGYIRLFLVEILKRAVNLETKEKLNLRELLRGTQFQLPALKNGSYYNDFFSEKFGQLVDISIKSLISIFGGSKSRFLRILLQVKDVVTLGRGKERRIPYEHYCEYMLENLSGKKIEGNQKWNDYEIQKESGDQGSVSVNGDRAGELFYDLLIRYIKDGKYKREGRLGYGR